MSTAAGLPGIDELLGAVMSDVRNWGRLSSDQPLTIKGPGIYLKRGGQGPCRVKSPVPGGNGVNPGVVAVSQSQGSPSRGSRSAGVNGGSSSSPRKMQ